MPCFQSPAHPYPSYGSSAARIQHVPGKLREIDSIIGQLIERQSQLVSKGPEVRPEWLLGLAADPAIDRGSVHPYPAGEFRVADAHPFDASRDFFVHFHIL